MKKRTEFFTLIELLVKTTLFAGVSSGNMK